MDTVRTSLSLYQKLEEGRLGDSFLLMFYFPFYDMEKSYSFSSHLEDSIV